MTPERAPDPDHQRPPGVSDATVEALGKVSEAWEHVERARGHLFSLHQLMGHADLLFGEAADQLHEAGHEQARAQVADEIVGRNILDGRWTFQVVDEFDDLYYQPVRALVKQLEQDLIDGRRHVFEAEMKEDRRTHGRRGQEARPPAAHTAAVDVDDPSG